MLLRRVPFATAFVLSCVAAIAEEGNPQRATIPDPKFVAKAGDRALLKIFVDGEETRTVPIAENLADYLELEKCLIADDVVGIKELAKGGQIFRVESGTAVLVREVVGSRDAYAEIRFTNGPRKDRKGFVALRYLVRMIENPDYKPKRGDEGPRMATTAEPARYLRMAQDLEARKSYDEASSAYEALIRDQPKSPEAKIAAERIQAMRPIREAEEKEQEAASRALAEKLAKENAARAKVDAARARVAAAESEQKAAKMLRTGKSLEAEFKPLAALSYYRRIVAEHPATAAAKTARARIKALGAKP